VYCGAVLLFGVFPRDEFAMLQMLGAKVLQKLGFKRFFPQTDAKAA
jgi:hypothetical protein